MHKDYCQITLLHTKLEGNTQGKIYGTRVLAELIFPTVTAWMITMQIVRCLALFNLTESFLTKYCYRRHNRWNLSLRQHTTIVLSSLWKVSIKASCYLETSMRFTLSLRTELSKSKRTTDMYIADLV